ARTRSRSARHSSAPAFAATSSSAASAPSAGSRSSCRATTTSVSAVRRPPGRRAPEGHPFCRVAGESHDEPASRLRVSRRSRGWRVALLMVATLLAATGEGRSAEVSADPTAGALARRRPFESAARRATAFRTLPASDQVPGADPVAIRHLAGAPLLVGLLRGRSRLVLLDENLREIQRLPTPPAPSGLAVT